MKSAPSTVHRSDPIPERLMESVLERIDPNVLDTMDEQQRASVTQALRAELAESRRGFHVRGVLPLGFTRLYFHFVVGRDRRRRNKIVGVERRAQVSFFRQMGFLATLGLGVAVAGLILILAVNNLTQADLLATFGVRAGIDWILRLFRVS